MRPTFRKFVRHRLLGEIVERINLRPWLEKLGRAPASLGAAAEWNVYMRHRFTSPPMLSIVSLLGLLDGREGLVLDAPCGMGHLAFMISKLVEPNRIVCMDVSPAFAYSAKRFFVPDVAAAVAHDMNLPLPLSDRSVGAIFCSDAFHYVDQRAALAREFLRILRDDGVCVLAHLHNSLVDTAYAGNPLTPAEYRRLFDGAAVRVFPESYRIDAYIRNKPLDLTRQFSDEELKAHRVLDVIAARSPDAFGVVPPSRDALIESARNPRPSGLYRMTRRGAEFVFELHVPRSLQHEYSALEEMLPQIVSVPANLVTRVNGRWLFDNQRELLQKHVLMDLPRDY